MMQKKGLSSLFRPVELTQGECWKTILAFSFPIIVSYLLQQVYTISDAAIVGQTLTAQEVAGVNDTSSLADDADRPFRCADGVAHRIGACAARSNACMDQCNA